MKISVPFCKTSALDTTTVMYCKFNYLVLANTFKILYTKAFLKNLRILLWGLLFQSSIKTTYFTKVSCSQGSKCFWYDEINILIIALQVPLNNLFLQFYMSFYPLSSTVSTLLLQNLLNHSFSVSFIIMNSLAILRITFFSISSS